ncbi:MAG: four helix bundle protein [Pyrinomonadaceae bacterium]
MRDEKYQDLRERTKCYALEIIRLYSRLAKTNIGQVLGKQVLRSGTSVGAHYREACRAKSDLDFVSKIEGALQELDETNYWLELLQESKSVESQAVNGLLKETTELISMFVSMTKNTKRRIGKL